MATITEDYCDFEIAKLLKEKGFDEPCYQCYVLIDKFVETSYYEFAVNSKLIKFERLYADEQPLINSKCFRDFINNKDKSRVFAAPTLQMAMKWLREVHNIHIELNWDKGNQLYNFSIWKPGKYQPEISSLDLWRIYKDDNYLGEWNYEETAEKAIQYSLKNLI